MKTATFLGALTCCVVVLFATGSYAQQSVDFGTALDLARKKIGTNFLEVIDLVLYNLALSSELEQAIEMKMVQEQEAAKAKFTQLKAQIDADTAIIRAKGEAEAIEVRGTALRANPAFIKLEKIGRAHV